MIEKILDSLKEYNIDYKELTFEDILLNKIDYYAVIVENITNRIARIYDEFRVSNVKGKLEVNGVVANSNSLYAGNRLYFDFRKFDSLDSLIGSEIEAVNNKIDKYVIKSIDIIGLTLLTSFQSRNSSREDYILTESNKVYLITTPVCLSNLNIVNSYQGEIICYENTFDIFEKFSNLTSTKTDVDNSIGYFKYDLDKTIGNNSMLKNHEYSKLLKLSDLDKYNKLNFLNISVKENLLSPYIKFQNNLINLIWNEVNDAASYQVESFIADEKNNYCNLYKLKTYLLDRNQFFLSINDYVPGTYYFRISAQDRTGKVLAESRGIEVKNTNNAPQESFCSDHRLKVLKNYDKKTFRLAGQSISY